METLQELSEKAKQLSPDDRVRLVELVLDSLDSEAFGDTSIAWTQDIENRAADVRLRRVSTVAREEIHAEAKRLLSQ